MIDALLNFFSTKTERPPIDVEHPALQLTHEWRRAGGLFNAQHLIELATSRKVGDVWLDSEGMVHISDPISAHGEYTTYEAARREVERAVARNLR